jgi:hypothetical protein
MPNRPMSDERLAAIRRRAEMATPGPWEFTGTELSGDGDNPRGGMMWIPYGNWYKPTPQMEHDAAFIVHAREDIPELFAEIERLRTRSVSDFLQEKLEYPQDTSLQDRVKLLRLQYQWENERPQKDK